MGVGTRVGFVGVVALAVTIAVTRYDGFNEGGPARYRTPPSDKDLVFSVKVQRYNKLKGPADPKSPLISWTINSSRGTDRPTKTTWSSTPLKVPAKTFYALYVSPGENAPAVVTHEVTVTWGGMVICGPVKEEGTTIPRCEGYTG